MICFKTTEISLPDTKVATEKKGLGLRPAIAMHHKPKEKKVGDLLDRVQFLKWRPYNCHAVGFPAEWNVNCLVAPIKWSFSRNHCGIPT